MTNRNRVKLSKLALGLALALAAAPAFAQNTTSAIAGRVSDSSGKPLAGAQVTILHTESGTVSQATTDGDGRYVSRGLRAGGPYTVTITKDGKTEKREGVFLQLAETESLDATVGASATELGAVVVQGTGDSPFSPTAMGVGTAISKEKLESFASIRRDLQDYARLDPRVARSTGLFGDTQISVAGQNNRYNSITIDGVTTSDTFGLSSNGLPTAKQPISIDTIDSVQVNVSNYDVTQTAYTGANVNAVTKSGTNEYHGSLTYVFRNDKLSGDRYNPTTGEFVEPTPFKETTKGITFGGPLIKDRLFFFAAYEDFSSLRTGVEWGPIGSDLKNVGITQAQIDTAISLAARPCVPGGPPTCGMDIGTSTVPGGTELSVKDSLFKLDWNISNNHRASLRYNKTEQSEPFLRNFFDRGLSLSSHWDTESRVFESAVGQLFSDWTENFSTELKLAYRTFDRSFALSSNLPDVGIQFRGAVPAGVQTGTRTLRFGAEASEHFNQLNTDTFDGYLGANWYLGDHQLKFGVDYTRNSMFNAFQQNTKGRYTFECLLSTQCSNSFEAGVPLTYTATVPQAGLELEDAAAIWALKNAGYFVQDSWSVNDNLTLLFGVRMDVPSTDDRPRFQETPAGLSTSDALVPGTGQFGRQTGGFGYDNTVTIDGKELIQPRFGFNYTFDTDRPTQLRGGFGRFQGAAANVWLSNPFTNTGEQVQTTGCGGSLAPCGLVFSSDGNNPPVGSLSPPQLVVDIIDPGMSQPAVWKGNLGFEHELPWWGVVASADVLVTQTKTALYYQNLNVGASSVVGSDGRSLFWNAAGYNAACFNADGSFRTGASAPAGCVSGSSNASTIRTKARSNSAYGNVILATPTDKGGSEAITVALSKPMTNNWAWSMAYTNTHATEVSGLTSSTSGSQWGKRGIVNPNEEVESRSNYEIRDRFNGTINWSDNLFGDYKTQVGLFYEGRSGKPYSWVFYGDMNGDGQAINDLLYIPTAPGSGEVIFRGGAAEEAAFWAIVDANSSLGDFAGGTVDRNSARAPWVNQFDLRITQELPGFMAGHKAHLGLDILNVGNLLNKRWGDIYESLDVEATRQFVRYVGMQGDKYVYSLTDAQPSALNYRTARGESSWAAQLTFKYEF